MNAQPTLPITGRCNCGAVAFEVSAPFVAANYCHCARCQRRTGTGAAVNGRAAHGSFRVTEGGDRLRLPADGLTRYPERRPRDA